MALGDWLGAPEPVLVLTGKVIPRGLGHFVRDGHTTRFPTVNGDADVTLLVGSSPGGRDITLVGFMGEGSGPALAYLSEPRSMHEALTWAQRYGLEPMMRALIANEVVRTIPATADDDPVSAARHVLECLDGLRLATALPHDSGLLCPELLAHIQSPAGDLSVDFTALAGSRQVAVVRSLGRVIASGDGWLEQSDDDAGTGVGVGPVSPVLVALSQVAMVMVVLQVAVPFPGIMAGLVAVVAVALWQMASRR